MVKRCMYGSMWSICGRSVFCAGKGNGVRVIWDGWVVWVCVQHLGSQPDREGGDEASFDDRFDGEGGQCGVWRNVAHQVGV